MAPIAQPPTPPVSAKNNQQLALALKQVIESVYTDGITSILKTNRATDGTVSGRFADHLQVYNFSISPKNELTYNEADAEGGRSDAYLLGYTIDSGMALRGQRLDDGLPTKARTPNCTKGKRCGDGCVERGLQCKQKLSPQASQAMAQIRSSIAAHPNAQPKPPEESKKAAPPDTASSKEVTPEKPASQESQNVPFDEDKEFRKSLLKAGLTTAAVTGIVGAAALTVQNDLKQSQVRFEDIRQPPDGIPDKETLTYYDTLKPGDLVRKAFTAPGWGARHHYGVYVGKDPKTGQHMMIETTTNEKSKDKTPTVQRNPLTRGAGPSSTQYERVPTEEMYREGTQKMSGDQIVKRAESMLGKTFAYKGFESNCESLARAIVEGKGYSAQGDKVSGFTNFVAGFVTDNASKVSIKHGEEGEEGIKLGALTIRKSEYGKDKGRMTAQQIATFLNQQKASSRKDADDAFSAIATPNPEPEKPTIADEFFAAAGMQSPDQYETAVELVAEKFPAMADSIRAEMYKNYLMMLMTSAAKGGPQSKQDSIRLDKPCGAGYIANDLNCTIGIGSSARSGQDTVPFDQNVRFKRKLATAGLTTGFAAAVLGAAAFTVIRDIKVSSVPFDSIRQPPDGIPDAETLKVYDRFKPGDLIRKNFKSPLGAKQHYAVYVGKDPKTREHMIIDAGGDNHDGQMDSTIMKRSIHKPDLTSSQYEKVPESQVFKSKEKPFTQKQILERAHSFVGQRIHYKGFESNCESFARGMVTGVAHSTQGDKITGFTNAISNFVTDQVYLGLSFKNGVKVSNYGKDTKKMTAQEMTKFLQREKAKSTSKLDAEDVMQVMPDAKQYAEGMEAIANQFPPLADAIRVEMIKNYVMALLLLARSTPRTDGIRRFDRKGKPCGEGHISAGYQCRVGMGQSAQSQKVPFDRNPRIQGRLLSAGLNSVVVGSVLRTVLVGAAIGAGGGAVGVVAHDFKRAGEAMPFESIRQPPGGVPDAETLRVYDTFQPGDMIRKNFRVPGGAWQHYSIYTGKDPKTKQHMMIDVSHADNKGAIDMRVRHRTLVSDASPESTQFERVPEKEIYQNGQKPFSQAEILERAHSLVGKPFTYQGFESNCESFAHGIVTGKAKASQRERITDFGNAVSILTTEAALRVKKTESGVALSDYNFDRSKMTAAEMVDWLEKDKRRRTDANDESVSPPSPVVYASAVELMAEQFPAIADLIRIEMYKRYFLAMFAMADYSKRATEMKADSGQPCGKGYIAAGLTCQVGKSRTLKSSNGKVAIGVTAATLAGAATLGMPIAAYLSLRGEYRAGFVQSAEMAKVQGEKLIHQKYPVSDYEHEMAKEIGISMPTNLPLVPDVLRGHTAVMRETMTQKYGAKPSQIPLAKQITIVANGFDGNNNGNGGASVANELAGEEFSDHHIVPISNEGFSPKPVNGTVPVKDVLKTQLSKVLRDGRNPVAVRMAATAYAFHQKHPNLPINLIGYSGAGMASHEAAEILKHLNIPVKVANFGSPYWGLTEKVGPSVTFNSAHDYVTSRTPVRDEVNVHSVKDHSAYLKNPIVRAKLKDFFDGKAISGEAKRSLTKEEKAKVLKRKKAQERAVRMQQSKAARAAQTA